MVSLRFYLASTSPRRIEMLKGCGYRFRILSPDVDERPLRGEGARSMVLRLAKAKAHAGVAKLGRGRSLVLAADTCVVSPAGRRILGKPRSKRDAERMLRIIQGRWHVVYTAFCLVEMDRGCRVRVRTRAVSTRVKIKKMSRADIRKYVATGEPMDKAGSYAAQGIGMSLVESIRGSYSNVVGLPLCEVVAELRRFSVFR